MKSCLHLLSLLIAMISPAWSFAQNPSVDTSEVMVFLKGTGRKVNKKKSLTGILYLTNTIEKDTQIFQIDKSRLLRLASSTPYRMLVYDSSTRFFPFDSTYIITKPRDTITITLHRIEAAIDFTIDPILFKENTISIDKSYFEGIDGRLELFHYFDDKSKFDEEQHLVFEIHGHRCPHEKKEVSLKRALALKDYVVGKGIPLNQIKVIDKGSKESSYYPNSCGRAEYRF